MLDFYGSFGAGASYVRYKLDDVTLSTLNPGILGEVGWQGLKFGKYFAKAVHVSLRTIILQEKNVSLGMGGMEISVGRGF